MDENILVLNFLSGIQEDILSWKKPHIRLTHHVTDTIKYLKGLANLAVEHQYALFFDGRGSVIELYKMNQYSTAESVEFELRPFIQRALTVDAFYCIMIHNHPGNIPFPSEDDAKTHNLLKDFLGYLDINLTDSLIISGDSVYSFTLDRPVDHDGRSVYETLDIE